MFAARDSKFPVIITAPTRLPFRAVLLAADVIMSTSPRLSPNDVPTRDSLKEHSLTRDVLDGVIIEFKARLAWNSGSGRGLLLYGNTDLQLLFQCTP